MSPSRVPFAIAVVFSAMLAACGDTSSPEVYVVEGESQPLPCSQYSTYRCREDHSDRCRLNEGFRLALDEGCYEGADLLNCTDIEACVEGEWIAESIYGELMIVRGCVNDPPPGSSVIADPSESELAAAGLSCSDAWQAIDAMCRRLSVQECSGTSGCMVRVEEVIDPDLYCDTGETRAYCQGITQVRLPAVFELPPCP